MPQGKGTYGSQVGRPSKTGKKKYEGGGSVDRGGIAKALDLMGGSVDPFSLRNPEGVPQEQAMDMLEDANMAREGLPTTNAQERSQVSPDVTSYKEGGPVKVTKKVSSGTVHQTGQSQSKTEQDKKGKYTTKTRVQVDTPEGKRWYEGEGKSSRRSIAKDKAKMRAVAKAVSNPADSVVTGGKVPTFDKPKKKKGKKK